MVHRTVELSTDEKVGDARRDMVSSVAERGRQLTLTTAAGENVVIVVVAC